MMIMMSRGSEDRDLRGQKTDKFAVLRISEDRGLRGQVSEDRILRGQKTDELAALRAVQMTENRVRGVRGQSLERTEDR
jgi:hypothetical protein